MTEKKIIDIHMHIGGSGDSMAGCRMSNEFILSHAFSAMLTALRTSPEDVRDKSIRESTIQAIETSDYIDYAVLLSVDGVYRDGKYIKSESHFVTPNDYIIDIVRNNKKVLFGASVHPYREPKEMMAETMLCIENGAVLFNWIPSSQQIDLEDARCIPFYEILAYKGIPLLCSIGVDAVPSSGSNTGKYSSPKKLEVALEMGVKVIVALGLTPPYCRPGLPENVDFDELLEMLKASAKRHWELYVDLSSFCPPVGMVYIERINKEISEGALDPKMFLYGSDFPLPPIDLNMDTNLRDFSKRINGNGNYLDSNYSSLKSFGVHDSIFTNACDVLKL